MAKHYYTDEKNAQIVIASLNVYKSREWRNRILV